MAITVKFFASLRENLGEDNIKHRLDPSVIKTAEDVWKQATNNTQIPPNTLIAVNMEYVDLKSTVMDGDEVAFFPPVTGG